MQRNNNQHHDSVIDPYFFVFQDLSRLVLATDMSRHNEILGEFESFLDSGSDDNCVNGFYAGERASTLKQILIKACDVSNECMPVRVSEAWVECLLKEYFQQVL